MVDRGEIGDEVGRYRYFIGLVYVEFYIVVLKWIGT